MKVLHLLKSEPCDLVEKFVETLFDKENTSLCKLYETDVDWRAVADDIFSHDKVICWW